MPKRPAATRRWLTAATWPIGIALTSWDYMWRTTPMRRQEAARSMPSTLPELLSYPAGVEPDEVQGHEDGAGLLFHRCYRTLIRDSTMSAEALMEKVQSNPNCTAPTKFARFQLTQGTEGNLRVGDEFVVRMPGPWDGPVRVIDVRARSFRLATLTGHLEAGQIEFRTRPEGELLVFEIESWARSSTPLVNLLYHRLRMAKEVQAHMWISFLERVVDLSGGRMTGGVEIETERIAAAETREMSASLLGSRRVQRRLAELPNKALNFDLSSLEHASPATGWTTTDLCQALPAEPPGMPTQSGSWEIARRLMRSYEFADPSIVRAYYDPDAPLQGRNMLFKLQALGIIHLYVGVRVGNVYEEVRELDGDRACVWGWNYRTLEGHVEMGEMAWEVWKWPSDGRVEFRIHAVARVARIRNPIVRLGFYVLRERERQAFLESTKRRMLTFTQLASSREHDGDSIRNAAASLTARPGRRQDPAHDRVARNARQV
jgi:uncharacterized protein (UPF0548 family)